MANRKNGLGKLNLLSSTALTRQVAAIGSLGLVFGASSAFALDPNALPQDPNVVGGNATFNQAGSTLTVNQTSNRTVIDWRSFDIGSNATTNFVQPGSSSIAVNRVNSSANPTEIQGHLNANGQVWILNPNGVMFGKTAKIDVAGIVASTANIDAHAFMAGDNRLQLSGADHGSVSNEGTVTVADGGLAAFVAPSVRNSGVINARLGKVTLAAGTTYTLDLAGDRLVEIGLGANNAVVDQSGQILADGSRVVLTAKAASAVVDSVVNVSGTVLASGVHEEGGSIVLTADNVTTTADAVLKADAGTNGDGGTIYGYADKLGKYNGTFSAKGGSASGNGGFIETSGKKVQIANGISIDTRAANGETGNWTIDPDDLTVTDDSTVGGPIDPNASTVTNATIVDQLLTTGVTLAANNSITVDGAINSSGAGNLALNDQNADNDLTINLNAKITLGAGKTLSGQGTTVNVSSDSSIQNGVDVAKAGGAAVNVAAGAYDGGIRVNKQGVTLTGAEGAKVNVIPASGAQLNGFDVTANDVTIQGFEVAGEIIGSYLNYAFDSTVSRGIFVYNGVTNFNITGNNIHDVRTGVIIDGRNTGSITNNAIDNTKGAVSIQYTDAGVGNTEGYSVAMTGNSEGAYGNEWGVNVHLNGHQDGGVGGSLVGNAVKIAAEATSTVQQALLANSAANGGWSVQDQGYSYSNRTSVYVDTAGSASNQGSQRAALNSINDGIKAVVTGGTVHVNDGTYVIAAGGGNYVHITKALNLIGESEAGTIIDASGASTYGIRVQADNVSLSDFTVKGPTSLGGYGIKVEPLAGAVVDPNNRLVDFSIANVTIKDSYKTGLDLNGVNGATIDHVTVTGATHGNGVAMTDTANATLTNVSTSGNAWGGLALYQTNGTYNQQVNNISVDTSNSFGEANGIYLEDQSASKDYGTLNIAGYDYAVGNNGLSTDVYTWLQKTEQDAIDFAAGVSTSTAFVRGWTGAAANNVFTVGYNTAHNAALSINAAITAATTGATVNVLSGTYNQTVTIGKGLTLQGAGIDDTTLTGGINLSNTAFSDLVFKDFTVSGASSNAVVKQGKVTNFTMDGVRIDGGDVAGRHGFASGTFAGDISITNSEFVNIRGWSAFDTGTGGGSQAITSVNFSNNLLENSEGHVAFRLANPSASVLIADNIVRDVGATDDLSSGIFKVMGAATVDFLRNNISGIGANGVNHPSTSSGILDGAALILSNVGVANITDNTFTNNQEAILIGDGNALPTITNLTGNTFTNNAYDIQFAGATGAGALNFGAGNTFTSGAQTQQHLLWGGTSNVDMTNVEFDGKLGSEMTSAELFALEDLITHGTDLASSGLVTVKDGNVYVTANSGSIQRGINKAAAGDTVNVNSGTYDEALNINKNIDLVGAGSANTFIKPTALLSTGTAHKYDANVQTSVFVNGANDVNISGFTIDGNNLANNAIVFWNNASGSISDSVIKNAMPFSGAQTGHGLAIDATTGNTSNLDLTNVAFSNWNKNAIDLVTSGGDANLNVYNSTFVGRGTTGTTAQNGILLWERAGGTITATIDGSSFSDIDYTGDNTAAGVLIYGSPNATLSVSNSSFANTQNYVAVTGATGGEVNLTDGNTFDGVALANATLGQIFDIADKISDGLDDEGDSGLVRLVNGQIYVTQASGNIQNGLDVASAGDTVNVQAGTYNEDVNVSNASKLSFNGSTINSYTQSVASAIGGTVTAVNGFLMSAATTLLSNTVLNGAVTAAAIDGGANTLAVNGGATVLNGDSYKAASLTFNGTSTTLTAANTAFNTATSNGDITFTGPIFGTTDGAQSLSFNAGTAGDISLQNAGTNTVWLGDMVADGHDFSAATVYVNSFTSQLTGNQTFTDETLNTKGGVQSNVGGNASGPINAGGNVDVTAGGAFSGNVTGDAMNVTGQTVTGTFTGNTLTLGSTNGVNVTANVGTLVLNTPSGTVNGTFTTLVNNGGTVVVNGKTHTGDVGTNPNQIVVEGFTLPAGAFVTSSGEIVLPNGMLIGLVSPAAGPGAEGGKPKVIIVHSVRKLGELLAQGYAAIIVDLNKDSDDEEVVAMN